MGLAPNHELFHHALNMFASDAKDPRSLYQREDDPILSNSHAQADVAANRVSVDFHSKTDKEKAAELAKNIDTEIGFVPTAHSIHQASSGTDLTKDESSRDGFLVNKKPIHEWTDFGIVIALGHKRLTAEPDGSLSMTFKDVAATPEESLWKFVRVPGWEETAEPLSVEDPDPLWHIIPMCKPGWALTCTVEAKSVAHISPLLTGAEPGGAPDQVWRYTEHGNLLPGPSTETDLALWVAGPNQDCVCAIPRQTQHKKSKMVQFTNKKGESSMKKKEVEVEVDVLRKLKWSVLPEQHHLVMLPRILRTTHAHSPFFRVTGEDARNQELALGPEKRLDLAGKKLIAYSPLLPYILGAAEGSWQKDKFWALCQLLGCPLVDRTGKLDTPFKFHVLHPIPSLGTDPGPLADLMKNRVRQLLDQYIRPGTEQKLQVLWSGGIDTTAVVVALLEIAREDEKPRILIRYCARSVTEYPLFFDKFIKDKFPCKEITGHVRDAFDDGPTVTGDPADMLMGTLVMAGAFKGRKVNGHPNALHFGLEKDWRQVIPAWMKERGLLGNTAASVQDWLAWMEPFVQASPIPIITVFDWLWWVTYALKYQHDLMRVFYNRETIPEELRWNVVNFFEPDEFHRWSFHHHADKMPDKTVWASYKLPLKDYICQHTKDEEYRKFKTKVQSVRNSWGFELAITEQWEVIRFGKFSVSMRRLREKYGRDLDRFIAPQNLQKREAQTEFGSDYMPLKSAAAVCAGGAFLTLAAFRGAEIFDPSNQAVKDEADHGGGNTQFTYVGE